MFRSIQHLVTGKHGRKSHTTVHSKHRHIATQRFISLISKGIYKQCTISHFLSCNIKSNTKQNIVLQQQN